VSDFGDFAEVLEDFIRFVVECDQRLDLSGVENTLLFETAEKVALQFKNSLAPFKKILRLDPDTLKEQIDESFRQLEEVVKPCSGIPLILPPAPKVFEDVRGSNEFNRFCGVTFSRTGEYPENFGWEIRNSAGVAIFKINDNFERNFAIWISKENDFRSLTFKYFGTLVYADDLSGNKDLPFGDCVTLRFAKDGSFTAAIGV
jgi:hypothetical protein